MRDLTRAGFAHVLGWDGSVYDDDAGDFAQTFYRSLAAHDTVPHAAARARLALRQAQVADNERGRHWHLARLYLGPAGGGAERRRTGETHAARRRRRSAIPRRRAGRPSCPAQRIRRLAARLAAGVQGPPQRRRRRPPYGMANLGKSSLAARVASRLSRHRTVVFARYDALAVFDRLGPRRAAGGRSPRFS